MMTKVICIGTGACYLAQRCFVERLQGKVGFVFMDGESALMEQAVQDIMAQVSAQSGRVVLLATLGGNTGSVYVLKMADALERLGAEWLALVITPFGWEGNGRVGKAMETVRKLERYHRPVFIFCNERLMRRSREEQETLESFFQKQENRMLALLVEITQPFSKPRPDTDPELWGWMDGNELFSLYSRFFQEKESAQAGKPASESKGAQHPIESTLQMVYDIGMRHYVTHHYEEAFKWLNFAAEEGAMDAELLVARMYEEGLGTNADMNKALEWYAKAAERGNAEAQFNMGYDCEQRGQYEEAMKWYRKAAKQGNVDALCNLGEMYEYGRGVFMCKKEAFRYYKRAATAGVAFAQYKVGYMYEEGTGVFQDLKQAFLWYSKADERHYSEAKEKLEAMFRRGLLTLSRKKRFKWKD